MKYIIMAIAVMIAFYAFLLALMWISIWLYNRSVVAKYRQAYIESYIGGDELTNRVDEYCKLEPKIYTQLIRSGPRVVAVTVIDGRERWLEKLVMHDEKCNNMIILMKADLKNGYGMS